MKHISLYKRNKLIYTIELEMSDHLFNKLFNKGIIEFYSTKGLEIFYLNNFDKVVITGINEVFVHAKDMVSNKE